MPTSLLLFRAERQMSHPFYYVTTLIRCDVFHVMLLGNLYREHEVKERRFFGVFAGMLSQQDFFQVGFSSSISSLIITDKT